MAETILHIMKSAQYIKEKQRRGNWPLSPKLNDPHMMLGHHRNILANGSAEDKERYLKLLNNPSLSELNGVRAVNELAVKGEHTDIPLHNRKPGGWII